MANFVAILNDPIEGMTLGEHHLHYDSPHGPLPITGKISGNVSSKVFINGLGIATVGSTTEETDACCGGDNSGGVIVGGFDKVTLRGKPIAMVGSEVDAHDGTASVSSSSQRKVRVG